MSTCVLCLEQNHTVERIQSHANCSCEITVHRHCYDQYINHTIDARCLYCRRVRTHVGNIENRIDNIIHRLQNIKNRLNNHNNNFIIHELEYIQNTLNVIANS
jgi:hypothetical protein